MNQVAKQLSLKEVSAVYHIPVWTLRSYVSRHLVPFRRVKRKIYFDVTRFESWLASFNVEPIQPDDKEKD